MSSPSVAVGIPNEFLPKGWATAVGFVRSSGVLHVSFPKVYDSRLERLATDTHYRTSQLILLVKVLARYSADVRRQPGTPSALGIEASGLLDWLEAAVELYDDYLLNGLHWVKRTAITRRASNDAIHWGQTLRRSEPFVQDGVPLFLEPYRRSRVRSTDDMLHRLHATLLDEIGLLLTGRTIVEGGQALLPTELEVVRADPLDLLARIERNLFADRPKRLVWLIKRYLQVTSEGAGSIEGLSVLCRSENFELIWEHMLRTAIENDGGSAAKSLPTGRWRAKSGKDSIGIGPRIDFAFEGYDASGRYLAIFDAKDRVASTSRSGSGQDHYKQIIYALLSGQDRLFNVLVFPSLASSPTEALRLLGMHVWDEIPSSQIFEASADYNQICDAFVNRWTINPAAFLGAVASLNP